MKNASFLHSLIFFSIFWNRKIPLFSKFFKNFVFSKFWRFQKIGKKSKNAKNLCFSIFIAKKGPNRVVQDRTKWSKIHSFFFIMDNVKIGLVLSINFCPNLTSPVHKFVHKMFRKFWQSPPKQWRCSKQNLHPPKNWAFTQCQRGFVHGSSCLWMGKVGCCFVDIRNQNDCL